MLADVEGEVVALNVSATHNFSKQSVSQVTIRSGYGIVGDTHAGKTVQHRSRVAVNPNQPNLRQVHCLQREKLEALVPYGFDIAPGDLGENVLTEGFDLLEMPVGTVLQFSGGAEIRLTGLRNPCQQIEKFRPGLLRHFAQKNGDGEVVRTAGVMAQATKDGQVRIGDAIVAILPVKPFKRLDVV